MADTRSEFGRDALSSVMGVNQRLGMSESVWERHYRDLRDGVMELIFRASRDSRAQFPTYALFRLVRTVQLLAFAFSTTVDFPWREKPVLWLESVASYANFAQLVAGGPSTSGGALRRAVDALGILVLAVALAAALSSWSARRTSPSVASMPLRVVKLWMSVGEPLLFVPAVTAFGAALRCAGNDVVEPLGGACAALGASRVVLAAVALIVLLLSSLALTLTHFPRSLASDSVRARPHGRVHAAETALVGTLALLFGVAQLDADPTLLAAAFAAVAAALLAAFIQYQPYYAARVNRAAAALYGVLAWAGVTLLLCTIEDDAERGSAAVAFLLGAAPAAGCSALLVDWRADRLAHTPRDRLRSPLLLELKVRPRALRLASTARRKETSSAAGIYAYSSLPTAADSGGAGAGAGAGSAPGTARSEEEDWTVLEKAYQEMLERRPDDALLSMLLTVVYTDLAANANMALLASNRAQAASPALDVRYYLFARQRANADAGARGGPSGGGGGGRGGSETGTMDPVAFIAYEHHMERAKRATHRARLALVRFWQHLDDDIPDLARIADLGAGLYGHVRGAQAAYRRVLSVNAESPSALRQYATFLVEVLNNSKEASDLLQQADEIEEARAKEHQRDAAARGNLDLSMATVQRGDNVDLYDDNNGIVTLSTEPQNLGEMLTVNASFARFLGYKRSQLQGRDINIVVPPPFSYYHPDMLRRYLRTRQGIFMNNTRPAFCLDAKGFLRGFLLTLRESTDLSASALTALQTVGALQDADVQRSGATAPAPMPGASGALGGDLTSSTPGMKIVGVLQPLDQPDLDVLWVDSDARVAACTRHVPAAFRFDMQAVNDLRIPVNDCIPGSWNPIERDFHTTQFTFLRYNARTRRVFAVPCEIVKLAVKEATVFLIQMKLRDRDVTSAASVQADYLDRELPPEWVSAHVAGAASEREGSGSDDDISFTHDTSRGSHLRRAVAGPPTREPGGGARPLADTGSGIQLQPLRPGRARRPSSENGILSTPTPLPDINDDEAGAKAGRDGGGAEEDEEDEGEDEAYAVAFSEGGDERSPKQSKRTAKRRGGARGQRADQGGAEEKQTLLAESEPLILDHAHAEPAITSQPPPPPPPPPHFDDTQSRSSGQSDARSSAASSSASGRVRSLHAAVERRNSRTDKTLVRLRRLLLGVLSVFILLAAADAGVCHLLYDRYQSTLEITYKDNIRFLDVSSSLLGVATTEAARYGLFAPDVRARARTQFRGALDELTAVHDTLYRTPDADADAGTLFRLREVRDNETYTYSVSSWSAIYQFIAKANLVYNDPTEPSLPTQRAMAFLRLNGLRPILMPMTSGAASEMASRAVDLLETIQWLVLLLLLAKMAPLAFTLGAGYVPTMRVIEAEKARVLRLFIEIPRTIVRAVLTKHRHNLTKAEGGDDEDSMSEEEEDVDALDSAIQSVESASTASDGVGQGGGGDGRAHSARNGGDIELHPSALKGHEADERKRHRHGKEDAGDMSRFASRRSGDGKRGRWGGRRDHLRRSAAGRAFQHSRSAFWTSVLRFAVLWVGIAAYFSATFGTLWAVTDWSVVRISNVEAASRRAAYLPYVQLLSMYYVTLPDAGGQGGLAALAAGANVSISDVDGVAAANADYTSRPGLAPVLEAAITELVNLDEALVYGSEARSTTGLREDGSSDAQIVLTLEDTCAAFSGAFAANCTAEEHGVLTHGLQNAIRTYSETVREVVFARERSGVEATLATSSARLSERLEAVYLRPAARKSLEIYESDARDLIDQVIVGAWVQAVVFLVVAAVVHLFVFRTMLARLDLELRETRAMLLLVPTDVAQRVPAIRTFMSKMVEDAL